MSIERNDDIIKVDGKLYQFKRDGDCRNCAFDGKPIPFCKKMHCSPVNRIDMLTGNYKAI